ncbi:MAG TPA: sensor histidine kinase [Gemmatimonadales bacterium]|nr:sensor histidine kinase [Gemmatimonadales bacterium]
MHPLAETSGALVWFFVVTATAGTILIVAIVASILIQQRRYLTATRALSGRLLTAHEEERARVARELHDDLIQRVAVLASQINLWEGMAPAGGAERAHIGELRSALRELGDEIRGLAHRMHPSVLDRLGLAPALTQLADEVQTHDGLDVTLDLADAPAVGAEVALTFYRVAQESLRNVVRHAGAREAAIALHPADGGARLEVRDLGRGFDTSGTSGGIGLTSMAERMRLVGGRLAVTSSAGEGTRVSAWAPVGVAGDGKKGEV